MLWWLCQNDLKFYVNHPVSKRSDKKFQFNWIRRNGRLKDRMKKEACGNPQILSLKTNTLAKRAWILFGGSYYVVIWWQTKNSVHLGKVTITLVHLTGTGSFDEQRTVDTGHIRKHVNTLMDFPDNRETIIHETLILCTIFGELQLKLRNFQGVVNIHHSSKILTTPPTKDHMDWCIHSMPRKLLS